MSAYKNFEDYLEQQLAGSKFKDDINYYKELILKNQEEIKDPMLEMEYIFYLRNKDL